MTEKRAKHCLAMMEDPKNPFNKLILAIGGISIIYNKDPYTKTKTQKYKDLSTVESYSIQDGNWERYNAHL